VAAFNTYENATLDRGQEILLAEWMGARVICGKGAFPPHK